MTAGEPGAGDVSALLAERLDTLAGQLAELSRRMTTAEAGIQGLGVSVAEAASLAQEVERLSETLAGADGGGQGSALAATGHPRKPPWRQMSAAQYKEGLRELSRWVTTVLLARYRYTMGVLPACWPAHPEAVEELDVLYWLWAVWATPGEDDDVRARDAADWHDRWLPGVLGRLAPLLRECAERGDHVGPRWSRKVPEPLRRYPEHWPEAVFIEAVPDLRGIPSPDGTERR